MKLALWQGEPAPDGLAQLDELAESAMRAGADLLLLPELFLGGYVLEGIGSRALRLDGPELQRAARIAELRGIALCFGFPEAADGRVYNSVLAIESTGAVAGAYRKTHLFGAAERSAFSPGDRLVAFTLAGVRVGLLVCYDVEFPEAVRCLALDGCELVLVPTANFEPYNFVNERLVPCRAFENHVHVACKPCPVSNRRPIDHALPAAPPACPEVDASRAPAAQTPTGPSTLTRKRSPSTAARSSPAPRPRSCSCSRPASAGCASPSSPCRGAGERARRRGSRTSTCATGGPSSTRPALRP